MSNSDWWSRNLGNSAPSQSRPDPTPPMPPSQQPMAPMPSFQPQVPSKAQSASQTASCPECGSSNYMAVQNAAPRCYDCGYPIVQQGSRYGATAGATIEGAPKAATGNDTANNWNPQVIVGRIE